MQPVSSSLTLTHRPRPEIPDGLVTAWILLCCLLIFAMAVIGAVTRLTESGLSIMEWAPIVGIVPPLSHQEWERIFALYRQIPEYRQINAGMTLEEFKSIFWWEWLHRFWGRTIAIVFALPFFWFLWSGRVGGPLAWKLGFALLLGALQGALGWYMVASGFAERTDVSQYRLVAHLALALVIYGWLLWIAFDGLAPAPVPSYGPRVWLLSRGLVAFLILMAVVLAAGGFVAGLNAGLTYNTFPLMDGRWIPEGYGIL
ncbi:MAG: COX15/CtaA family protein, partial [Kiloniellales bacterium]